MSIGYCRRRKIRCLLAENDLRGRCQSCIRLRKDCIFSSVGQDRVHDSRPQAEESSGVELLLAPAASLCPVQPALEKPLEDDRNFGSFPTNFSLPVVTIPGGELQTATEDQKTTHHDVIPSLLAHEFAGMGDLGLHFQDCGFWTISTVNQQLCHSNGLLPNILISRSRNTVRPWSWASSPQLRDLPAGLAHIPYTHSAAAMSDSSFFHPVPKTQNWHTSQIAGQSMLHDQINNGGSSTYTPVPAVHQPQRIPEVLPAAFSSAISVNSSQESDTLTRMKVSNYGPTPDSTPVVPFKQPNPFAFQSQGAVLAVPIPGQLPDVEYSHWEGPSKAKVSSPRDIVLIMPNFWSNKQS